MATAAFAAFALLASATVANATIGLYNQTTSTFYLKSSASGGIADVVVGFGPAGRKWIPISGDWNGDGTITIGLYDPTSSVFFLRNQNAPGIADVVFQFGPKNPGAIPIAGDWNGDGVDTIGLYQVSTGIFVLRNSNSAGPANLTFVFGSPGLFPVAGDWDGDGRDGVGVYASTSDVAFLRNTLSAGAAQITIGFAPLLSGEFAIAGDFNGDGIDTVSRFEGGPSRFLIHNDFANGGADFAASFGPPNAGWLPLTWQPGAAVAILDPTDGNGGFLWKPVSDSDGNLVILLPSSFNNKTAAVEVHRALPPNQNTFIEGGRFVYIANGNREHWRFRRPGRAFGKDIFAVVFMRDGRTFAYPIPDGAQRVD